MAVVRTERKAQLQVVVNIGTTSQPKSKKINVTNWALDPSQFSATSSSGADHEKAYTLGQKVAAAQTHPFLQTIVMERYTLEQQA